MASGRVIGAVHSAAAQIGKGQWLSLQAAQAARAEVMREQADGS
jgi:hypothetical protein